MNPLALSGDTLRRLTYGRRTYQPFAETSILNGRVARLRKSRFFDERQYSALSVEVEMEVNVARVEISAVWKMVSDANYSSLFLTRLSVAPPLCRRKPETS